MVSFIICMLNKFSFVYVSCAINKLKKNIFLATVCDTGRCNSCYKDNMCGDCMEPYQLTVHGRCVGQWCILVHAPYRYQLSWNECAFL